MGPKLYLTHLSTISFLSVGTGFSDMSTSESKQSDDNDDDDVVRTFGEADLCGASVTFLEKVYKP